MNHKPEPITAAEVARERREGESMMDTKHRLQEARKHELLHAPWQPDFATVRDKRMSEMTPEQREDAHELWLREQMDHMAPYYQEHLLFLLDRLDQVRAAAYEASENPVEAVDAEFDAAHTSADPRAVDTLVEALDQTLRARGFTIVPAEELAADVRELSAALLDEQQRLEWLMQKVNCDEIGDEIQIPFGLSLGRHFDEFRRQIDQAKGEPQ